MERNDLPAFEGDESVAGVQHGDERVHERTPRPQGSQDPPHGLPLVLVHGIPIEDPHVHVRREAELAEHPEVVRGREGPPGDPGHEVLRPPAHPREVMIVQVAQGEDRLGPGGPPVQLDLRAVRHRPEGLQVRRVVMREDPVPPRGPDLGPDHVRVLLRPRVPMRRGGDEDRDPFPGDGAGEEPMEKTREEPALMDAWTRVVVDDDRDVPALVSRRKPVPKGGHEVRSRRDLQGS